MGWPRRKSAVQPLAIEIITSTPASGLDPTTIDKQTEGLMKGALVDLVQQTVEDRRSYASWLLRLIIGQAIFVDALIVVLGLHWFTLPVDVVKAFLVSVFAEVVSLPLIVARGLYPNKKSIMDDLSERFEHARATTAKVLPRTSSGEPPTASPDPIEAQTK